MNSQTHSLWSLAVQAFSVLLGAAFCQQTGQFLKESASPLFWVCICCLFTSEFSRKVWLCTRRNLAAQEFPSHPGLVLKSQNGSAFGWRTDPSEFGPRFRRRERAVRGSFPSKHQSSSYHPSITRQFMGLTWAFTWRRKRLLRFGWTRHRCASIVRFLS